jgi:uncharacterized protein YbjT (DUF2867 family)
MDTTTPPNRVLVIGASGALGRPTIRLLLDSGIAVRGICRHPEAAADLAAAGAEVVTGDLTDRASIERALSGAKRVLVAAHGLLGRGRWRSEAVDDAGHRTLIDAARAAGVERFVYTSALMASPAHPIDFARTKHTIEETLASSGLTYAILRPTAFMEHHVHMFNGLNVLKKGKAQLVGRGTKKRNFVSASDVAQLAVRALMDDQRRGRGALCTSSRQATEAVAPATRRGARDLRSGATPAPRHGAAHAYAEPAGRCVRRNLVGRG